MSTPASDAERWLPAAQAGSKEALAQLLESCRGYLLFIAAQELDPALRAKGGASDLVQETMLEAYKDFVSFHGTEEELLVWLRNQHSRGTSRRRSLPLLYFSKHGITKNPPRENGFVEKR